MAGFRYCDLLLAAPERAAWQLLLRSAAVSQRPAAAASPGQQAPKISTHVSASEPAAADASHTAALRQSSNNSRTRIGTVNLRERASTRQRLGVRQPSAAFVPARSIESARGLAHSKTWRTFHGHGERQELLRNITWALRSNDPESKASPRRSACPARGDTLSCVSAAPRWERESPHRMPASVGYPRRTAAESQNDARKRHRSRPKT